METNKLIIAIILFLMLAAMAVYVYLTYRKDIKETPPVSYVPIRDGLTHDKNGDYYNPLKNEFTITLQDGNQMTWKNGFDMTAYESLELSFKQDGKAGRLKFQPDTVGFFLLRCEHLEDNGWPVWDPDYKLQSLSAMSAAFKVDRPKPAQAFGKSEVSACCKALLKKGHHNAKKCSKCNKFTKAIQS